MQVSAPTPYSLSYDFTAFQTSNPSTPLPADKIEIEYNNVSTTTGEIIRNLGYIQRTDGELANSSVGNDQLKSEVIVGVNTAADWVTLHIYHVNDTVYHSNIIYRCLTSHTSGVFATDLSANKWAVLLDFDQYISQAENAATRAEDAAGIAPLSKYNATVPPTVDDDSGDGYGVGSRWVDITHKKSWICISASLGAAVWQAVSGHVINVKDFGAKGDNSTDDRANIQAAEDFASALGVPSTLYFSDGKYAIGNSINKKANVHWRGKGYIRRKDNASPTGSSFGLIVANNVDNWSIEGLGFENVPRSLELSALLVHTVTLGNWNTCMDVFSCDNWYVRDCYLTKFSGGILFRECEKFSITDNHLDAQTGKTVAEIEGGTYANFSAYSGTGGIYCLYNATGLSLPSKNFIIANNYVEIPGLDVAIAPLLQTYDKQPSIVSNNRIRGCNAGIMCYRGSFTDPGSAPTYQTAVLIQGNHIYATNEQGIYIRGVVGCQVLGNYLERCGYGGANGDSSAGSIMLRVNSFTAGTPPFATAVAGTVTNDYQIIVQGNRIANHGREDIVNDAAVQIELDNVMFLGNAITRANELYTTARGVAINLFNGKQLKNLIVDNNHISGKWTAGINGADVNKTASLTNDYVRITNNTVLGTYTSGIIIDWRSFNANVSGNIVKGSMTNGISVRNAPFSIISNNIIHGATNGITLQAGTQLSSAAEKMSAAVIGHTIRRGSSVQVTGNRIWGATTSFNVTETNGDDASFYGRCSMFEGNFVDGVQFIQEFAGGTPASTFTTKTHVKHTFTPNTSAAGAATPGKVCITSGQYGSTTTTTGDTTSGSPIITNVALLDGYGPGMFISTTGFTGTVQILSINTTSSTITVNQNAGSSNSTVTLTAVTPTFATYAVLT